MTPKEIMGKVLEETYILSSALEVKDVDMALGALKRRDEWILMFNARESKDIDADIEALIRKFDEENKACVEKMGEFKSVMELELYQVKAEKTKTLKKQKVHDSYSNPYTGGPGTTFDLKK